MNNIAIQGHPTRGKEVIQILESLGGINLYNHLGNNIDCYYEIHGNTILCACTKSDKYKYYTLEEFEKEFPFKIGDKVMNCSDNEVGTITNLIDIDNILYYNVDFINSGQAFMPPNQLKSYKEMKEKRNITLTLDKAKEWYKKGRELKEVALQAYSEEELTEIELPKTWEEFCENYPVKKGEACINDDSEIDIILDNEPRDKSYYKNICPSKESAEAHLAMIQLEQLRDCYRQGDIPDFNDSNKKYCIIKTKDYINIIVSYNNSYFLSFTKKEVAQEFINNFKPLIKIAENYI